MSIPFNPRSRLIRVPAVLEGNQRRLAILILDTGASLTVLKPGLVTSIRARPPANSAPVQMMTAGGLASAQPVRLDSITLQGQTIGPLEVLCAPLPDQLGAAGLLGLDILRHFNVALDFEHGQLNLARIHPTRLREPTPQYHAASARAA